MASMYEVLNTICRDHYEIKCIVKYCNIEQYRLGHRNSLRFLFALCSRKMKVVKRYFDQQNLGTNSSAFFHLYFSS